MRKIPTVFQRDPDNRRIVVPVVTPGCEWVLRGEGVATRKYDGTCVMFDGCEWWARREVRLGRAEPPNFVEVSHDEFTGKTVGWEPIRQSPFCKFFLEAMERPHLSTPGTYELCGPKINGNPEAIDGHSLIKHENAAVMSLFPFGPPYSDAHLAFSLLEKALSSPAFVGVEGVVFHHPDGRMAKIKRKDFDA